MTKTLRTQTRDGWTTVPRRLTSSEVDSNFLELEDLTIEINEEVSSLQNITHVQLKNLGIQAWEGNANSSMFTYASQSGGSVIVTDLPNGLGINVKSNTINKYVDIVIPLESNICVNSAILEMETPNTQNIVSLYFGNGPAIGNTISKSYNVSNSVNTGRVGKRQSLWFSNTISAQWSNTGNIILDEHQYNYARVRCTQNAGQTAEINLYKMNINPNGRSRIAIISDDGYLSWLTYAVPLLSRYGIPSTLAIIPSLVGTNVNYANLKQLRDFVASGNECIAHGPVVGSTLYSDYTTDQERIDDINNTRDFLETNGLSDSAALKCYVYPGGVFASTPGDTGLLDLMYESGITLGRTVTRFLGFSGDYILQDPYENRYTALTLPIIGYIRSTVNESADLLELNNTMASIETCAMNGLDGIIMLHNIIPKQDTWTSTASTDMTIDYLKTLVAKLVEVKEKYNCEFVKISKFAP